MKNFLILICCLMATVAVNAETITVSTESDLNAAIINGDDNNVIQLTADIDLTATITIPDGKNIRLDLNGHVLNAGNLDEPEENEFSCVIYNDGMLIITDSNPTATHTQTGLTNVTGGVLTGGKGSGGDGFSLGGAIDNEGILSITGITITGNTADMGGAIINSGRMLLKGTVITNNIGTFICGGIALADVCRTVVLEDCTITGNTASTVGAGVVCNNDSIFLKGNTVIKNNTVGGKAANLCIAGVPDHTLNLDGLTAGAEIGVSTLDEDYNDCTSQFTTANTVTKTLDATYFFADNSAYKVAYNTKGYLETVENSSTSITLNEVSTNAPKFETGTNYDVTVNRTLKANQWNSLCLPLDMTATETTSFGTIMKMTKIEDNVVYFETADAITAGEMYIVKPTEALSTFTLTGKKLSTPTDKTFGTWTVKAPMYAVRIDYESGKIKYILGHDSSDSKDKFYKVTDYANVKGFRWFIQSAAVNAKQSLGISLDGCETTDMSQLLFLDSQLRDGKYVENGRLVINKNGKKVNAIGQRIY